MNLSSKGKKRVVLPSRPEPPTVEQILEDVKNAASDDPLFSLDQTEPGSSSSSGDGEVELKYEQCRRFMDLNLRLTEAQERLKEQHEELKRTGHGLQADVLQVRTGTLS